MTAVIEPAATIGEAWLNTLRAVNEMGGSAVNTLTTLTKPGAEAPSLRRSVDTLLKPGKRGKTTIYRVETVANTLFPEALYLSPGLSWSPADLAGGQALDQAAEVLYDRYREMLPLLRTADGNNSGTYFERMTHWPAGNQIVNQLADRIHYLRNARRGARGKGVARNNVADIAVAVEAEAAGEEPEASADAGLQVYASTDRRQQGFPCLVHIDLSVHEHRLHMLAVYRHWYVVTKGYGNMLGLSRLLAFLSEQTGYEPGELAVVAGTADAEHRTYGGHQAVARMCADMTALTVA